MQSDRSTRIVANWILLGIFMLIVQVLIGGITRLTGSGLSITEWKPIMGFLLPSGEAAWNEAFDKYKAIAQYKYINQHFELDDFKFIYFWEWFHRLWARLIGVAFLIPFIYFIAKGYFKKWMIMPLVVLFLLGILQGFVGWIMVQSGLNENDVYVSHIRLAAHFVAAMVLIAYAQVFWLKLKMQPAQFVAHKAMRNLAIAITALLVVQLTYGAFMAGMRAGTAAPTWPDINGSFLPAGIFSEGFWHDAIHHKLGVHFIHRNLAYLLSIIIAISWWKGRKIKGSSIFTQYNNATLVLVLLQIVLGVLAVITADKMVPNSFGRFEWSALLHQLNGMLLLLSFTGLIYISGRSKQRV